MKKLRHIIYQATESGITPSRVSVMTGLDITSSKSILRWVKKRARQAGLKTS